MPYWKPQETSRAFHSWLTIRIIISLTQYYSNTTPFVPHWFFSSSSEINWSTSSFWDLGISLVVGITWKIAVILPLNTVGFKTNT
jgi:hypothetical protein